MIAHMDEARVRGRAGRHPQSFYAITSHERHLSGRNAATPRRYGAPSAPTHSPVECDPIATAVSTSERMAYVNELIQQIIQSAGITPDKANTGV